MRRGARAVLLWAALPWAALPTGPSAARATAGLESAEEIRACMRANLPERTSHQLVEIGSRDLAGGERVLRAQLDWKRFDTDLPRVRILVEDPPDLRGASYLLIEPRQGEDSTIFMYLPAVQRVRRIAASSVSDPLWGTDFSYEDVRQLQWMADAARPERLADGSVSERPTYVLSLGAGAGEGSAYQRVVSFVDRETCVSLRVEFYERGDTPRKVLSADIASLEQRDGRWLARMLRMHDLREQTTSWLHVLEVENDVEISDRLFNPTLLDRGH